MPFFASMHLYPVSCILYLPGMPCGQPWLAPSRVWPRDSARSLISRRSGWLLSDDCPSLIHVIFMSARNVDSECYHRVALSLYPSITLSERMMVAPRQFAARILARDDLLPGHLRHVSDEHPNNIEIDSGIFCFYLSITQKKFWIE